jgi:hypothetical protein
MAGIEDRKDAFEKKYAHDQEVQFKVSARTSKLIGLWAAEQMGLKGADAETYAKQIVMVDLEEAGFADVKRRIMKDFADKKVSISDHVFERELEMKHAEAKTQIMEDRK